MSIRRTTTCALIGAFALGACGTRAVTGSALIGIDECRGGLDAPALVCEQRTLTTAPSVNGRQATNALADSVLGAPFLAAALHAAVAPAPPTTEAPMTAATTLAAPVEAAPEAPAGADEQAAAEQPAAEEQQAEEPDTTPAPRKAASKPKPKPAPAPAPAPAPVAQAPDTEAPAPQPEPDPAPAPAPAPAGSATPGSSSAAAQVVALTNAERAKAGLGALTVSGKLTAAAAAHSADQASHNTMTHTGSNGSSMSQRISATGFAWRALGENVAMGYANANSVMTGWMNSPGHRKNILTPGFTMIGVALAAAADGSLYWTMDLATPA